MYTTYGFSVIPKCMTLSDPEQLFHVKFWLPGRCEIIHALLTNRVGVHGGVAAWPCRLRCTSRCCAWVSSV